MTHVITDMHPEEPLHSAGPYEGIKKSSWGDSTIRYAKLHLIGWVMNV